VPFSSDTVIPLECLLNCFWKCPGQYPYLQKCPTGTCHRINTKYISFFKLSTITYTIPYRIIRAAHPKPHAAPFYLPKASVAEGSLFSLATAQPSWCSAKLVFDACCSGAVLKLQDRSRQIFSVPVERLFLSLTNLRQCRSTDCICCCLRWLRYGTYDSAWEAEFPSNKCYLKKQQTNQILPSSCLCSHPVPPSCHTFIFTTENQKSKSKTQCKALLHYATGKQ